MRALTNAGYKRWNVDKDQYGTTEEWQARVDIRDGFDESIPLCQCNDKLFFNVKAYDFDINGINHKSASIDITAENKQGEWCNLKIYSLTWEELESNLSSLEAKLLRMWNEFNRE